MKIAALPCSGDHHCLMKCAPGPEITPGPVVVVVPTFRHRWIRVRHWCHESARLVLKIMRPALVSTPFTWALAYSFTLGNAATGKSPENQTDDEFLCMTAMVSTSTHCASILAPYILSLRNFTRSDDSPWTKTQLLAKLVKQTWWLYLIVHALALGVSYVIVRDASEFASTFKPHLYLTIVWNSFYRAGVDESSRRIYQRETMEGARKGYVNQNPYWRRYFQALCRSTHVAVIAALAASLVHICSAFELLSTNLALLQFSIVSVVLKALVLTVTKRIVLKQGSTNLRKIYVLAAVPTVLINTQVRLAILRSNGSGSTIVGFIQLGLLEPLMRLAKVWHLQRSIKRIENEHTRVQSRKKSMVAHRISVCPAPDSAGKHPSHLARRATIIFSHQNALHFHAAESHADMCSEYIAIACSTAIYFFLQHNPRFGWHQPGESDSHEWIHTATVVLLQVGIEIPIDLICCVFELANGVPLRASESLGGFLTAVFTSSALVSVSISAFLFIHPANYGFS